nr:hypothetical protein [uncultured Kingella sp.]
MMKFKWLVCLAAASFIHIVHAEMANKSVETASESASAPVAAAIAASVPQVIDDEISRVWKDSSQLFNDTILLPPAPDVTANAGAQVNLRNQAAVLRTNTRIPSQLAKIISLPEPKKLTRREVLQQEISREKSALLIAQNNLVKAGKEKNDGAIKRFGMQVADRIKNIQALQEELRRY